MRYFKVLIALSLFTSVCFLGKAQLVRDLHGLYNPANFYQSSVDTNSFEPWYNFSSRSTGYSLEVGTSFSSFGGSGGFSTSYISPMVAFSPTEQLQIVAGGKFSNTNLFSAPFLGNQIGESQEHLSGGNPTEFFAYGRYQVNQKLSVYGIGAFGQNQLYVSPFQSGVGTADYQQFSFGMDYKISEKVKIGASFGVSNGPGFGVSPYSGFGSRGINPFFP